MNFIKIPALILIVTTMVSSCRPPLQEHAEKHETTVQRSLIATNQYMRERHRDHMKAFSLRAGWDMTETSTGLWFEILEKGTGPAVEKDKLVVYTYETRLLNGTVCYAAGTENPVKIISGKGNIGAGLEEGLRYMREGGKARFLIPPHLAHGNFGDGQCIPGSSVLLITAEVLEVKR
jgi:FKBP-type peptidyl-prolyl cis-trans isomerase